MRPTVHYLSLQPFIRSLFFFLNSECFDSIVVIWSVQRGSFIPLQNLIMIHISGEHSPVLYRFINCTASSSGWSKVVNVGRPSIVGICILAGFFTFFLIILSPQSLLGVVVYMVQCQIRSILVYFPMLESMVCLIFLFTYQETIFYHCVAFRFDHAILSTVSIVVLVLISLYLIQYQPNWAIMKALC